MRLGPVPAGRRKWPDRSPRRKPGPNMR
jgi:hypothetical protein